MAPHTEHPPERVPNLNEPPTHLQQQGKGPQEKEHCQSQDTYFYQALCRGNNPAAAGWPKRMGRACRESHKAK